MKNSFKVKVNSKWEFDIPNEDVHSLDVVKIKEMKYHLLEDYQSFQGEIIDANFNKRTYVVKVNGSVYNVFVENQLDQLIKNMGFSTGSSKNVKQIKAPMPGVVLGINVEVGQEVSEDDALLVLEAMKMESTLVSPSNGVVKTISVSSGETVEKGQLLIEFE
ncbi:MAG: acetyl-CoA carboxylase biotin carboxyl carrier protein subunit [Flavobacteriaceae bacterium]|nr:acetyl-CoA carboxylase biotin carboxyl carrier protein subunit [Flavobacteriaceae bacterium]